RGWGGGGGGGSGRARGAPELRAHARPRGGLPIRFIGNVEGGDLLTRKVDVIVADGFTGNVALKVLEGTAAFAAEQTRAALTGSAPARFGALFQRRGLRELAGRMDAESYGGAAVPGAGGTVGVAPRAGHARGGDPASPPAP